MKKPSLNNIKNRKYQITFFLVCFLFLMFFLFMTFMVMHDKLYSLPNGAETFLWFFTAAFFVLSVLNVIWLYRAVIKEIKIEKMYLFAAIFLLFFYLIIFPPATVPDESAHIYSSYWFSNMICCPLKQLKSADVVVRRADYGVFADFYNTPSVSRYISTFSKMTFFNSGSGYKNLVFSPVFNAPLGYIGSAIGITVARILNLGTYPMLYLGRIANAAVSVTLTYFAIKRTPIGKTVIFVLSTLPMVLHLTASFSYDSVVIALVTLFVANVLYCIKTENELKKRDLIFCLLLSLAVSISKIVYIPVLIMLFFIPSKKISKKPHVGTYLKFAAAAICALVFFALQFTQVLTTLNKEISGFENKEGVTIAYAISNLGDTFFRFVRTVYASNYDLSNYYISTMVGGSLGWLNIISSNLFWIPFYIVLILAFICEKKNSFLGFFNRILLILAVCFSAVSVMASMLFAWTAKESAIITGVQGRYFLPLVLPFFAAVKCGKINISENIQKYIPPFTVVLNLIFVMNICGLVFK